MANSRSTASSSSSRTLSSSDHSLGSADSERGRAFRLQSSSRLSHYPGMMRTSLPTGTLTSLEAALAALLDGVRPVTPESVPLDQALGRVAAEMPPLAHALPVRDTAAMDGWACRALDLVGASAYSPLPLMVIPAWVETGDVMPEGCDCILRADLVDQGGPMAQAVGEAVPGEGVRRAGEDLAAGRVPAFEGEIVCAADLLAARKAGLSQLAVRTPRVRVIDVAAASGETLSTLLVTDTLKACGATMAAVEAAARDAATIAARLDGDACDLIILVGGTGDGRADPTAEALARRGALIAHRIAIRPGGTTAIGRLGAVPVLALPGSPDQALGAFLALVQPVLDRLSGRHERRTIMLPLVRKIASTVGLTEIALLGREQAGWTPLAVGEFSVEAVQRAEAWVTIHSGNEGYAAGTTIGACPLRRLI
ncbi:molybdopterin-binding protein [Mesorhizobium sp. LHD-90]|uniref:molybdopterin-binding protein n=1 Tax=Mesorhizobium sp. LHD-90 TaxID=3071414 RepID=UPI0027E14CA4|nr:molybdopterin-binding protein [Mesorhizobium sp. LHD-90]MDQ6437690.1 molybdopterin-binding protein [Mesorhizobium sp. LHD-90]